MLNGGKIKRKERNRWNLHKMQVLKVFFLSKTRKAEGLRLDGRIATVKLEKVDEGKLSWTKRDGRD